MTDNILQITAKRLSDFDYQVKVVDNVLHVRKNDKYCWVEKGETHYHLKHPEQKSKTPIGPYSDEIIDRIQYIVG